MPIGDILAQISGGEPTDKSAPKRKAEDTLRNVVKAARSTTTPSSAGVSASRSIQPSRPLNQSTPTSRPLGTNGTKPASLASRPVSSGKITKPSALTRPMPSNAPKPAASSPTVPKAPPKKGSFAEIMARAQKAQQTHGQVGKIQHKKVEGGSIKRDRDMGKAAPTKTGRPSGYSGTSKSQPRDRVPPNGTVRGPASKDSRGRPIPGSKPSANGARNKVAEEPVKKVKKAALATTGYMGTSRPRPGSTTKKDNTARGGALLNGAPPRPSSSSRSRYDNYDDGYDEDMDDFIDYDDEEDDGMGPRYDYASDGSSDMEAGLDELDVEERRAEQIARREDIEEERMERDHKAAKEARKRAALEALRSKRS